MKWKSRIRHVMAMLLLLTCLSSCIYDKIDEEPESVSDTAPNMLSLNVSIPRMRRTKAADGSNGGYESGVDFENYIDVSAKGMRVYIFNSRDKFVTRLVPMGEVAADITGNTVTYTVTGVLPDNFPVKEDIKVAVLANWPVYNDDLMPGVSTIDDLCNAGWAVFNRMSDFILSEDNKIPLFGIHEYSGLTFTPGEETKLPENITLLRAMAKVEVVVDNAALSLRDAKLRGLNSKGYCAPAGVYSQSDYDHNGTWDLDYVKTLHLWDGINDYNAETQVATLLCRNKHSETKKETWVCYVPEYKNTDNADGSANYKCRLELLFDYQEPTDKPSEVFFVEYDTDGKPVAGTDHDINRNNCYRFTVDLSHGLLFIKVKEWENAYDNDFIIE